MLSAGGLSSYKCVEDAVWRRRPQAGLIHHNVVVESFFGNQAQWQHYQARHEVLQDMLEYISMFYNSQRLNSYLNCMSFCGHEQQLLEMKKEV